MQAVRVARDESFMMLRTKMTGTGKAAILAGFVLLAATPSFAARNPLDIILADSFDLKVGSLKLYGGFHDYNIGVMRVQDFLKSENFVSRQ